MKGKANLDQLAVMLLSAALGVLVCALVFDGILRELFVYAAGVAFVSGLVVGALHLFTRR